METDLVRDAVIVVVLGLGLVVSGVPWRIALAVVVVAVIAMVALEATISDLTTDD